VLWFDTPEKISTKQSKELLALIRKLQPDCIVNSRVGHSLGDYGVSEQKIPGSADVKPWETCMTLNGHWGYFLGDEKWKSPETVIRNLVDIVSKGGNYLLNVGPTGEGIIPSGAVKDLSAVGDWMKVNGESIYGTTASPLKTQPAWGRLTKTSDKLYLHVFDWPKDGKLVVPQPDWPPLAKNSFSYIAYFLVGKKAIHPVLDEKTRTFIIQLPAEPIDPVDTVVVITRLGFGQ
jgi:alpha-L-fucosidase